MKHHDMYDPAELAMQGRLANVADVKQFITAGKATFTLKNARNGMRYTYRVKKVPNRESWFVSLLTGTDNESSYTYLGMISTGSWAKLLFRTTLASKMTYDSLPVRAIEFLLRCVNTNQMPPSFECWHEGRCGRCNRLLTVPESIERGIGPECASIMGIAA